ncbi:Subtilisin-like protease 2 [Penicillium hispanicum]|uniref:Subtilisin-like protease 2 n=1 Tax=Penicillium hispanicum TaxID=1080232 RepID=UPI0025416677|nr:Subtilisin-like protease 2 [Penicillium hispanicum]KAJ5579778.1 Subtilisin-like protease 2 [Penicillium hispanicum]
MMLLATALPLLLPLLSSTTGFPTTNAVPNTLHQRGWGNEGLVENVTSDDPHEYYYEDESGDIYTSHPWKRDDTNELVRRASGLVIRDPTSRLEMRFPSQPRGADLQSLKDFAYLDYAGLGARVYVHDSGINEKHSEFTGALPEGVKRGGKVDILQPKKTASGAKIPTVKGDPDGHGSCVSSKVIGTNYGIAKSASLTVVPFVDLYNDAYMLAGLQTIVDDIKSRKKKGSGIFGSSKIPFWAVVNLSYGLGHEVDDNPDLLEEYRKKYLAMVNEGALLIGTAGNDGNQYLVSAYPARFAEEDAFKNNMIVVGSVNTDGLRSSFSNVGSVVTMRAPGAVSETNGVPQALKCAGSTGNTVNARWGTSLASPQVAGLAAYLYSIDPSLRGSTAAQKIKAKIEDPSERGASYKRPGSGDLSIWNMQYGTSC